MQNIEQLTALAEKIAADHKAESVSKSMRPKQLNLEDNHQALKKAYLSTNEELKSSGNIIPAAEWLLDNYYVIEEQYKEIQYSIKDLYNRLPILSGGKYKGFPRIYGITSELVKFLEAKIEEETISVFLKAYQEHLPLISKELWAFPTILRASLLEHIKEISDYITETLHLRKKADIWADRLLDALRTSMEDKNNKEQFRNVVLEHDSQFRTMKPAYVERLLHRLREYGTDSAPIIRWIDGKLAVLHTDADEYIQRAHHDQAYYQTSMGNAVTSLRAINNLKWEEIFEELSVLDRILRQDPSGVYSLMDFPSRDYYRHMIERLAQKYDTDEFNVAVKAIECARQNQDHFMEKFMHVGYYIADRGRVLLESRLTGKDSKINEVFRNTVIYFGSISLLTLSFWFVFLAGIWHTSDNPTIGSIIPAALLSFLPVWSIAIGLVNWAVTRIYKPDFIPKLELKDGIPEEYRTMVVIPALLTDEKRVVELIEQMEVFYLANQEENLHFALIGDYKDGPEEHTKQDQGIIDTGKRLIEELNNRYARKDIFFFFHRHRQWNARQASWMGWERKRGALTEFNTLLEGKENTSFSTQIGDLSVLKNIKFVITLDADTQLPRDTAKKLIGAMAHPLNKPVLNKDESRVIDGYGLLQPRIGVSVDSASRSLFSLTFSGQTGIDPYTTAVSDVYQDLFHEGIFTGKGIYDPHIFNKLLKKAIPENAILSHDLLEGSYVRAGLASDIELIDGYPANYISYSLRLHRWVRGDWQLLPWLFSRVRNFEGEKVVNPINIISKWKILDNMRRSLVFPTLYLIIILSFIILPGSLGLWMGLTFLTLLLPLITDLANKLLSDRDKTSQVAFPSLFEGTRSLIIQTALTFFFIAHQAFLMTDAIIRSVWRVAVSRKNMLEWVTAADSDRRFRGELSDYWHKMKNASLVSLALCVTASMVRPDIWYISLLIALIWLISPYIAYKIGKPKKKHLPMLSAEQILHVRQSAVKTWRYFEELVNESENWLPPDNYQEEPYVGIAHRTSPTNIGLHLMSLVSARDLGYLSTLSTVEKIECTINTMNKLEKWNGHFYNWYNTVTLEPLRPLYVSTVDNGNLVGYLITLLQALDDLIKRPLIGRENILGLRDFIFTDLGKEKLEGQSLLNMLLVSENVSVIEWHILLDDLKGQDEGLDKKICEYERETSLLIPWINQLKMIPAPLLSERGTFSAAAEKMDELLDELDNSISIQYLYDNYLDILKKLSDIISSLTRDANRSPGFDEARKWLKQLEISLGKSYLAVKKFCARCQKLKGSIEKLIKEMDFKLLYDEKKELFAIGMNVEEGQLSKVYYDLLASEARQTSFIAIAKGDIPQKHWFKLGRALSLVGDLRVLVSWSGTMFEYFMPLLIMKNYENTLLDETYTAVVKAQKQYGEQHRVPWGNSESGFYAFDLHLNYQYKAFGVPKLGLKRGLVNDLVVAPYATFLALPVDPIAAYKNLEVLSAEGLTGLYGFYEAVDYTSERMPKKKKSMIVKSFMAHHQGMILTAINNYLNNNIMQARFHSVPMIKATELLLQERIPRREILIKDYEAALHHDLEKTRQDQEIQAVRSFTSPQSIIPNINLLSNGTYSVMLSDSGGGYSKYNDYAITRWREDPARDDWGMMFYIANLNSNNYWSAAYQPVCTEPDEYKVVFQPDQVTYSRKDGNIETKMEVVVSPEFNGEVRSISLTNHSGSGRMIEITSYFEVVLYPHAADLAHPAFANLFVHTEYISETNVILANRRPKSSDDKSLWLFHTLITDGEAVGSIQYETDRSKFIGRNRNLRNPQVMDPEFPLSNTSGAVLDPIVSMRIRLFIPAGETVNVTYITGVTETRESALLLARENQNSNMPQRAKELAWTHSQVELRYLKLTAGQASLFQTMASQILYAQPPEDWKQFVVEKNRKGQTALWAYGISGDLPIVVLKVSKMEHLEMAKQMLTAHEFFKLKGLAIDLILLNEFGSSYEQPVQERLQEMVSVSHARELIDRPGGVYIRQSANISKDDLNLLLAAARLVIDAEKGCIADQLHIDDKTYKAPELVATEIDYQCDDIQMIEPPENLIYQNHLGGFLQDGREYIIYLKNGHSTPLPWSNIIANKDFGFLVTESGSGYTWCKNSRENKLTPWSNDPVCDPAGEALYIRDDLTGEYWTVTALPVKRNTAYLIRHGQGYSVFQNIYCGIKAEQTVFAAATDPIKIVKVYLENCTNQPRELSLFFYAEWVLGVNREETARFIVTSFDSSSNCILAYNRYNEEFAERTAFLSSNMPINSYTSLKSEFLGRNGSMEEPQAMKLKYFSNRTGVQHDPCSAIQVQLNMTPGENKVILFLLGQGESLEHARQLVKTYNSIEQAELELNEVKRLWEEKLGVIEVFTPDKSMDFMLNRWLIYQTYACRMLARTGFYQAGGAFGFRDQLQDVMALVYCEPGIMRQQILMAAAHQFLEGDVQHWWHPPYRGVRTRITDDLLFLPFVTADYIEKTGDWSILDEVVSFLEEKPLNPDEHDRYSIPKVTEDKTSIYDHCIRAIERAMRFGNHGLPLMGGGDWNDGMDKVGTKGKGESVWLGWFLYAVLNRFIPVCEAKDDMERVKRYKTSADELLHSIEQHAWDGGWYRRAYFDDGTPLGSEENEECRIDSISQSWAVISGGGRSERVKAAMRAVNHYLVDEEAGLIKLLSPPFDKSELEPGYIKGYLPGVRENGGQYTHAAVWTIMAFARLGEGNQAHKLYHLINPVNHTKSYLDVTTYKGEPYVMAADVYTVQPHIGRSGWTWYTGSAGWMYQVGLGEILGFKKKGSKLIIDPCIPEDWPGFQIIYKSGDTQYNIEVKNPQKVQHGVKSITLDGQLLNELFVPLIDDGKLHHIVVTMGTGQ